MAVTIDEYDVSNVAVGQKAVIKSDATGDTEIAGTVSQVSLTATTTSSVSGWTRRKASSPLRKAP